MMWAWARDAHHWRIGQDITDDFDIPGHREGYYFNSLDMIDRGAGLEQYSGPGGWNDYDTLVVNLREKGRRRRRCHTRGVPHPLLDAGDPVVTTDHRQRSHAD
jgi:hypothetical protein